MKIYIHNQKKFVALYLAFSILFCALSMCLTALGWMMNGTMDKDGCSLDADKKASVTVVIDAGHGGEDCGAIGINGVYEKDLNLQIALALNEILTANGVSTVMTRTEDILLYDRESDYTGHKKEQDLATRRRIAEDCHEAIFISIHMNSFPVEKYNGIQVYYSKNNTASYNLAYKLQTLSSSALMPENNRKIKAAGENIYLLDRLECPAVLVECGFLSNAEECERLCDENYRKKLALCLAVPIIEQVNARKNNSGY